MKIDGEEAMVLLDGGAQIFSISRKWVDERGLPVYELEDLVEIIQAGGSILDYEGYTEVTITSDQIPELKLSFPLLVVPYEEYHDSVPLALGTKTLYHIHDNGILDRAKDLPTSWKYVNEDIRLKKQLEGQPDKPLGFAKSRGKRGGVKIGPNEIKVINCMAKVKCHGMSVNVLVEPCEVSKLSPGLEVQYSYTDIAAGSSNVSVSVKNNTDRTITIQKGTKIGSIFCANKVPKILNQAIKVSKLEKDIENSKQTNKANPNST